MQNFIHQRCDFFCQVIITYPILAAARTGDKANINSRRNDTFLATGGIRGAGGGLSPSLPCISGVFG